MFVLGINFYAHQSSAALLQDGRVIFAADEERFSRLTEDRRFPAAAIKACLDHAGISLQEVDAVAFGWNHPGSTPFHTLKSALTGKIHPSLRYVGGSLYALAGEMYQGNGLRALRWAFGPYSSDRVSYVDHHEAHAWSTYGVSGFDEATVIVMDGRGSHQASTIYHGRGGTLKPLKVYTWPNSLGVLYESFTDLLGFERNNDEWKVMGLAAYGKPGVDLSRFIRATEHGYKVDGRALVGKDPADIGALVKHHGPRRRPEIHISDADIELAASVQSATEEAIFAVVREGIRLTGSRNVCLAGGVALNSKANGRLLASGLVDDIFVQPAASDEGAAIGAALGAYARMGHKVPEQRMNEVYLGPQPARSEVEEALRAYKLRATHYDHVEAVTADLLAQGHIVGWFQGRMEFGPRALGNRSILADPRSAEARDRVNESVKFRESWRPFAPSCLEEAASEYFEGCTVAPFMIVTYDVRPEKRAVIPAVTHADNTARVQTVNKDVNPRYWNLIREFGARTGVPVVLNTSFNLRGEPIVCTPKDAIRTFYSSGLDFLVLDNFIVAKDPSLLLAETGKSTADGPPALSGVGGRS
jgi:carbamoyltransferase